MGLKTTLVAAVLLFSSIGSAETVIPSNYLIAGSEGDSWNYKRLDNSEFSWTLSQVTSGPNAGKSERGNADSGLVYDLTGNVLSIFELDKFPLSPPFVIGEIELGEVVSYGDPLDPTLYLFWKVPSITVPAGTFNDVLAWVFLDGNVGVNSVNTELGLDPLITSAVTDVSYFAPGIGELEYRGIDAETGNSDGLGHQLVFTTIDKPVCDIQLSQAIYVDGETVTADVLRLANLTASPVATEIKIWLAVPEIPPISVVNTGFDGSLIFPAGIDLDLGPIPILPVNAALPRGSYEFSCRMRDPITAELLAESRNFFEIQTQVIPFQISDFNPKSAPIGTLITIDLSDFDPSGAPQVTINKQGGGTMSAPVASHGVNTITFTVPPGATSGPVTVTADGQSDSSSTDLSIVASSDFTLSAGPAAADVIQGQSTSYNISINSANGFGQLAALGISGLPAGATSSFKPPQIAAGQTSILTISAPESQPVGNSVITISASATVEGIAQLQSANVTLNIQPVTTSFVGRTVKDDPAQTPLPGVTVTLLGVDGNGNPTGCSATTVSDTAGNFAFTNLPPECTSGQLIRYNGSTVTGQPGTYAGVDLFYVIADGEVTVSPVLIHLPRIDDKEIVCIEENAAADRDYVFNSIPNLSITVYAGTSFAPHPSYPPPTGVCAAGEFPLIAVDVPVDRLPDEMPPDPTAVEPFIVAFQPANTVASQPVAVSFPNLLNTAPGVNMELTTLDPTRGVMVIYGTGTVSTDGKQIVPDFDPANPGKRYGLVNFDWHGPRVPLPPDNPDDPCGTCSNVAGGGPTTKNPVDLSSGIEVISEIDISISGLLGNLTLQRIYRTLSNQPGPFGIGANHNYGYRLDTNNPAAAARINLVMPNGSRYPYSLGAGGTYSNTDSPDLRGSVMSITGGIEVELRWKDGTVFHFAPGTAAQGSLLQSITDANGNTTTLTRNPASALQITEITDPVGRKLLLSYDTANRITQVVGPLGRRVQYTYNAFGALETVKDPLGGITRYDYAAADELTQVTDARGIVIVQNAYDANGRVIQQTHADGGVLTLSYTLANPAAGANSPVLTTTMTNPLGHQTIYRFNTQGFVTGVTDALGQVRLFQREPGTNMLLSIKGNGECGVCGNPSAGDQFFTYDANGNRLTSTDGLGQTTTFTFEPIFNKVLSVTDPLNNTTSFTYDGSGNLLTVTDPRNNTTSFSYDASGLPLTITDPLPAQWVLSYDNFGNLQFATDPLGAATRIHYDLASRPRRVTDALGQHSLLEYDLLDRTTKVINARGHATQASYDPVGNLLSITDARSNTTSFTYDDVGRLQARTDSLGKADSRVYDQNDNLTSFTDRKGQTTTLTYDAIDRPILEIYDDGSSVARSYDGNGRLIQAIDTVAGAFAMGYDKIGRLTISTGPTGTLTYLHDAMNRVQQRQVTGNHSIQYTYDAAGNQQSVNSQRASISFTYDNRNLVSQELRGNGVITDRTYDALGRVRSIVHSKGPITLDSQSYVYDALGNIIQKTADVAQPLTTQESVNSYDASSNRLLQWGAVLYTHDDNGNRLTETDASGTTSYSWDPRNRLQTLINSTLGVKDFGYDYAGNLIEEIDSGMAPASTRSYLLDELTNIAQMNDAPGRQLSTLSGQGIDQHFAVTDSNGATNYGLADQINSTSLIVDDVGVSQGQRFYESFGETTSSGVGYPIGFSGRVPVSKDLYHYRARYFDSKSGRFISEDPIGILGGNVNLYSYAYNSPIKFIDPTGEAALLIAIPAVTLIVIEITTVAVLPILASINQLKLQAELERRNRAIQGREQKEQMCLIRSSNDKFNNSAGDRFIDLTGGSLRDLETDISKDRIPFYPDSRMRNKFPKGRMKFRR